MRPALELPWIAAVLVFCLAVFLPSMVKAQEPPGLSSGSGQGTGTGRSSGVQRSRSGSVSGSGPQARGRAANSRGRCAPVQFQAEHQSRWGRG